MGHRWAYEPCEVLEQDDIPQRDTKGLASGIREQQWPLQAGCNGLVSTDFKQATHQIPHGLTLPEQRQS